MAANALLTVDVLFRLVLEDARKQPSSGEMLLWMTPSEFPTALQGNELLDPMRASLPRL